ncbi:S41 family peptidase [Peristeroidobacter soli]|uniref:S41 family peptidase n=1 Tax=Peristeroidobacter soli TaxID=2497877 RepID=UPI00101B70B5|nr:S41 family peptidase [Peristeroidobacter soli]
MEWMARGAVIAVALLTVAGCGGGGGGGGSGSIAGGSSGSSNGSSNGTYTAGVFQPSSSYANQCSSTFTQNMFLRSWTNELYLWYSEVPDRDPGSSSTADYFAGLKTPAITASGRSKDQFHFTYSTAEWEQLSQSGVEVGYGAEWVLIASTPPRQVVVAYSEPNTPAGTANVPRGAEVLLADGVDVVNGNATALNAAFFPETAGETHTFQIREANNGPVRNISLTSVAVTHKPVLVSSIIDPTGMPVGYLLFNDHIATAEAQLVSAITSFRNAGVQDLILDLRYNGGGYLDLASELAYMIAGARTAGQTFERSVFNDKYPNTNPVEGGALTPTPFWSTAQGFSVTRGTALPTLNLNRVYVITSSNTCSASEAIINSLRGIDVEVYQIGSTTCGKPYGFYPKGNCGTTYFSIQFEGRNAKGFATYPDGFTPVNSPDIGSVDLPGCSVADDFTHPLGDTDEARLQAALSFRASNNNPQSCPAATGFTPGITFSSKMALSGTEGEMLKAPTRTNRILRE